jgi:predicted transposase/invertase (TIGR01784 family)
VFSVAKFLIGAKNEEDYTMLAGKKPVFKKVVAVVKKLSADEEARMEYDKHELWRMDYAASMRNATRRGLEKGITESNIETARKMKSKGFSIADIADITGLTKKEIEKM